LLWRSVRTSSRQGARPGAKVLLVEAKLIWRSETGQRAWNCNDSGLPVAYRRILDLVAAPTAVSNVAQQLTEYQVKQIQDWIDELETLCFLHASQIDEPQEALQAA
jgi:hypothetical protein